MPQFKKFCLLNHICPQHHGNVIVKVFPLFSKVTVFPRTATSKLIGHHNSSCDKNLSYHDIDDTVATFLLCFHKQVVSETQDGNVDMTCAHKVLLNGTFHIIIYK